MIEWNAYAVFALAAVLGEFALSRAADLLNLRALRPEPPEGFRHVYDAETYRRSQAYARARARLGIVASTADLAVLLLFWLLGGFGWLQERVAALGIGAIPEGLAFVFALLAAKAVLGLPFAWYGTFVLEERFGFNRSTPRTFAADVAKSAVLAVLLGAPLLATVLALFHGAGELAWVWCWAVAAAFVLAVQYVAPAWILPLFHRYTPLEEGELRERILSYAERVGFPLQGIFVIDGSRRSTKANAFFTGFGRRKRIALFDTLLQKHDPDEVLAVVAHEIGHYKRHHVVLGTAIGIAHFGLLFFLLSVFLRQEGLYRAFGVEGTPLHVGLVVFGILYGPIELVLGLLVQAFSRRNEYAADRYAAETTGRWSDLARGLEKLAADSLTNLTPHRLYVALHHSHPPMPARIEALRRRYG